ncbi:hypothetical protein O1L60_40125 [Streptomyces diastatochromogenes]|nr:hypothetical protein [Streptomyces diastatochromogenes]
MTYPDHPAGPPDDALPVDNVLNEDALPVDNVLDKDPRRPALRRPMRDVPPPRSVEHPGADVVTEGV